MSLTDGKFPSRLKTASVTPLLKSSSLDESLPSSYRPISNLNFISKILERLFLQRIQPHILASSNYNQHQSAYRPGHSTETALVQLLDSIYHAANHGKATLLFSLDLSAAFDTIDHPLLIRRLSHSLGITGSVLTWVQSYLTGRSQTVRLVPTVPAPHLFLLVYPKVLYWGHFSLPFTPLRSLTSLNPTI